MIKNLSHFIAFDAVARHLSFAKAARELGLAPSSVAKSVAKLEARIALKLFNRTTRTVSLTQDGLILHQRCAQVLAEIQALDQLADSTSSHVQGVLRLSAPVGYGAKVIMPAVGRLLERHSELQAICACPMTAWILSAWGWMRRYVSASWLIQISSHGIWSANRWCCARRSSICSTTHCLAPPANWSSTRSSVSACRVAAAVGRSNSRRKANP